MELENCVAFDLFHLDGQSYDHCFDCFAHMANICEYWKNRQEGDPPSNLKEKRVLRYIREMATCACTLRYTEVAERLFLKVRARTCVDEIIFLGRCRLAQSTVPKVRDQTA